jgi:pimeloyl-ACP methyl ester carboxylesterase
MAVLPPYSMGRTPSFACQADPRFSYCLYVPQAYAKDPASTRLLVAMHDTLRNNQQLRDLFADYAELTNTVVVAPLFPAGIGSPDDLDNYKYLRYADIRFDELVPRMVSEVARKYGLVDGTFSLFGFSGGAHFAHRFLYAKPERLESLVVASPGSVTLPMKEYAWWPGLADFERIFGRPVDWPALCRVPAHFIVGADDTNPNGIVSSPESPGWREGALAAGANRVERIRTLHEQLRQRGARVSFEQLEGVAHELEPVVQAAIRFLKGTPPRPGAAS